MTDPNLPTFSPIPSDLLHRIAAVRKILAKQGAIIRRLEKGRPLSYRLRYRVLDDDGKTIQVAVDLGQDESVAGAVKELIQSWRKPSEEHPVRRVPTTKERVLTILDGAITAWP